MKVQDYTPGQSLTLVRNDRYWGPKAHLDSIVFRFLPESTATACGDASRPSPPSTTTSGEPVVASPSSSSPRHWRHAMPTIELTAGSIEYQDTGGPGPVVVLLHGLAMNGSLWRHVVSELTFARSRWSATTRACSCRPLLTARSGSRGWWSPPARSSRTSHLACRPHAAAGQPAARWRL
jgi:hypothetical protein